MKVNWSDEALLDADAVFDYLLRLNPVAAAKVLASIHEAVSKLSLFPNSGPEIFQSGKRQLTVAKYGYVIVYRVNENSIDIANVFHGHEDWLSEYL